MPESSFRERLSRSWFATAQLPAAAAVAAFGLLLLAVLDHSPTTREIAAPGDRAGAPALTPSGTRTKGTAVGLTVHVAGQKEPLAPGDELAAGSAIRFTLTAREAGHAVLLGLDSAGAVTTYVPFGGEMFPIQAATPVTPDQSIVLDDTPGNERLFAIVCGRQLPVKTFARALRRAHTFQSGDPRAVEQWEVDGSCSYATIWFSKRVP